MSGQPHKSLPISALMKHRITSLKLSHLHPHSGFALQIMTENTHQRQDTRYNMHSYKEGNGPTDRPAMNSPTRVCAHNMSQQIIPPEDPVPCPGFEAANASYFMTSMPEAHPRSAPRARVPAHFTELHSRHGPKRLLDDDDEEATAEEPLHKRPRASAARQADKGTTAHESASGRRGAEDAVKDAETEQLSGKVSGIVQYGTLEDRFTHQERDNLNTDAVKSPQDGTDEAQQRRKSAHVESSRIAPSNITARSSGILQNRYFSRPNLGLFQKKVRFEDEIPGRATENSVCLGNKFDAAQEQMVVSAEQIPSATQRELQNQPTDADVMMFDV